MTSAPVPTPTRTVSRLKTEPTTAFTRSDAAAQLRRRVASGAVLLAFVVAITAIARAIAWV